MRAFMSRPDSGVRNLKPQLYPADRAWLEATSTGEARAILAETEPAILEAELVPLAVAASPVRQVTWRPLHWSHEYAGALAEALAAFIES